MGCDIYGQISADIMGRMGCDLRRENGYPCEPLPSSSAGAYIRVQDMRVASIL